MLAYSCSPPVRCKFVLLASTMVRATLFAAVVLYVATAVAARYVASFAHPALEPMEAVARDSRMAAEPSTSDGEPTQTDLPEVSGMPMGDEGPLLIAYEAGVRGAEGPVLTDGMTYCPEEHAAGFSIICQPAADDLSTVSKVAFYANSVLVRTEMLSPYTISGNVGNQVEPWRDFARYRGAVLIECKPDIGESVSANITFACEPSAPPEAKPVPVDPVMAHYKEHMRDMCSACRSDDDCDSKMCFRMHCVSTTGDLSVRCNYKR